MRNRWLILIVALAAVVGASSLLFAQGESASGKKDPGAAGTFNPHDLSGYWEFFNNTPGQGIYATPSKDASPALANRIQSVVPTTPRVSGLPKNAE